MWDVFVDEEFCFFLSVLAHLEDTEMVKDYSHVIYCILLS